MSDSRLYRTRSGPTVAFPRAAALAAAVAVAVALAVRFLPAAASPAALAAAVGALAALALAAARAAGLPPFPRPAYIADFAAWRPHADWFMTRGELIKEIRTSGYFSAEGAELMERVIGTSGLGEATAYSPGILGMRNGGPKSTYNDALAETEVILTETVADLLAKTGTAPTDIDVVITSCSCFAPTPSMAAMLVNKFGFRMDVLTYSLAGMGCASSLICVDMAKHMLKAMPNTRILVVNHENITNCWYIGEDKSMLVVNCLFRAGGGAALMTNIPASTNKYILTDTERTHLGRQDPAYLCMGNGTDAVGTMGVFLRKNVIETAGAALRANLTRLAPRVLPWSELARAAADPAYTPDFTKAFDTFLLHTGGRGVLDALQKSLALSDHHMRHSRAALARFGNTSAASLWYVLAHVEHTGTVARGQRMLGVSFGGGFKCNSMTLRAARAIAGERHPAWEPLGVPGVWGE